MSGREARDGRIEPRSKAQHDHSAFDRHRKSVQDRASGQAGGSRRPSRAARGAPQYTYPDDDSNPSSDDDEEETYRVEHRKRKSTEDPDDDDSTDDEMEIEEDEEVPPFQQPPQGGPPAQGIYYGMLVTHRAQVPSYVHRVNYRGKGMTERARDQRRIDPRGLPGDCPYDHRFHTMFQLDFYSSVILTRNPVVAKSQWIDWAYVREQQKRSLDDAITICQRTGVYRLMEFQHEWNSEVIAQFYATLFIEEEPRRMHWMLEGTWYSVDYAVFAGYLGVSEDELERDRIHLEQVLPPEQLGYMYPPQTGGGSVGKVVGLHPTYRYLDRMFRKTIDCKGGDKGSIADYSRNLLHRMAPDAEPFSIFDFIWCEIQSVGERPLKGCGFAPYIMHMIERVTGHSFEYDRPHKVLKIVADLPEIGIPPVGPGGAGAASEAEADLPQGGAAAGAPSPPSRAPSRSTSRRRSPPSPIRRFFSSIFGMCRDIQTSQQRERRARRKDTRTLKQISQRLELDPPRSPISDGADSEQETEEQRQVRYDREFAEFFQRQQQQQQSQQQQYSQPQEQPQEQSETLPLRAHVPPHVQPRPSAVEEVGSAFWEDIFGYPTGGYGYGGSGPFGEGGSRPPGAPRSPDETQQQDDDDE